jgi:hypothetical protein
MKKALALSFLILSFFTNNAWCENSNTTTGAGALANVTSGIDNTADGYKALHFDANGSWNTATGYEALYANIFGHHNTATGAKALYSNTEGENNTAQGISALFSNTTGLYNTAQGSYAHLRNTSGSFNTAEGAYALYSNSHGSYNTALGYEAGNYPSEGAKIASTGSNNVYIGSRVGPETPAESNTIRIGNYSVKETYITGIHGGAISGGVAVYVDANGQLGVEKSSRRYKEDIADMGDASNDLMKLRPVTFNYKPECANGPHARQYGLIAEEVAEVYPDLVQYDPKTGLPETVYYQRLSTMLLNEVQKHAKEITAMKKQDEELSALKEQVKQQNLELSTLKAQDKELAALKERFKELFAMVEEGRVTPARLSRLEEQSKR